MIPVGHVPATRASWLGRPLLHQACGGTIKLKIWSGPWVCSRCPNQWSDSTMEKFTDRDLSDRFYVDAVERNMSDQALVYATEGKTKFACLRPVVQADGMERVKI